jgi:hypothetical protein
VNLQAYLFNGSVQDMQERQVNEPPQTAKARTVSDRSRPSTYLLSGIAHTAPPHGDRS